MDSEKHTPENQHNPEQSELDLEFSQVEPITPKKMAKPTPSFFDSVKGVFAKKTSHDAGLKTTRQAPAFNEASSSSNTQTDLNANELTSEQPSAEEMGAAVVAPAVNWKNPETWPFLQILPQRHRRLFVALFGLILLLIIFFALKPSSQTVQSFEQQNSQAVPIQFQPLEKGQTVENTILDNLNQPADNSASATQENTVTNAVTSESQPTSSASGTESTPMAIAPTKVEQPVAPKMGSADADKPSAVEKVANEKVVSEKPKTAEKPKTVEKAKVQEKPTPTEKAKVEKKVAPVVEASPAKVTNSKTLTIPQGVSLMQVFRNHNLNIADVNAMTKATGAGNALSNFKAGDKVQISVNSQGRVNELRLENGAKFIRQADGSYIYKK
ncbi:opacity-associated protein OapA [Pasteurella multocida]|uniref:opacity-associated protein OapA n=1 Tax=Pasteurella multocida TaxID=747 RepID=UPI000E03CD38|nr:opacity-associated protein OapA [Pasteurella multocida]MEB3467289.1 opacity-associated protein OapA [Pasteurella multocida]MEB3498136.1 opacity-associated protein OapA [Pasteurella multocida]SUB42438.1 opacity-associated protein OapA [Pasteurella multocida subsp. septica]HDR1123818.1 opacity-associated protein OapA [Pasteurella multocida]HDR1168456.1 opacity-associated protein OapA [Pasteurella multocida]